MDTAFYIVTGMPKRKRVRYLIQSHTFEMAIARANELYYGDNVPTKTIKWKVETLVQLAPDVWD